MEWGIVGSNLAFLLVGFWFGTFRVGQTNLLPKIRNRFKSGIIDEKDPYLESMEEPEVERKETTKDG
jgi:hypothetical protein